jgi:hypothetical protein
LISPLSEIPKSSITIVMPDVKINNIANLRKVEWLAIGDKMGIIKKLPHNGPKG